MSQWDMTYDLIMNVDYNDLYLMSNDFALYLEDCLMDECYSLR